MRTKEDSLFLVVSHGDALSRGQRVTSNTVLFWDRDTSFLPVRLSNSLCKVGIFRGGPKRFGNGLEGLSSGHMDRLSGEERFVRMLCVEVAAKLRPLHKAERLSQCRVVAPRDLVASGCPFFFSYDTWASNRPGEHSITESHPNPSQTFSYAPSQC